MWRVRGGARSAVLAAGLTAWLLAWPVQAHAGGLLRHPVSTTTSAVTQTVSPTSDSLASATQTAAGTTTKLTGTVPSAAAVVSAGETLLPGSGGSATGSSGSSSTAAPTSSTSSASASHPSQERSAAPAGESGAERSDRALVVTGTNDLAPSGAYDVLYQGFAAPAPPRYGGVGPNGLAVTGAGLALPLGVLVALISVAVVARTTERVRARLRLYGALRYRGRHRMPSRWTLARRGPSIALVPTPVS